MSTLTLLIGLPCSGKTSYAKTLEGSLVEMEQIRKGAAGNRLDDENVEDLIHHLTQRTVHFYLNKGNDVIVDAPFLTEKERKLYIMIAKKLKATVEVIWMDPSFEVIKRRIERRNEEDSERKLEVSMLEKMACELEIPTIEEGIDTIHYISNT